MQMSFDSLSLLETPPVHILNDRVELDNVMPAFLCIRIKQCHQIVIFYS